MLLSVIKYNQGYAYVKLNNFADASESFKLAHFYALKSIKKYIRI
jgi:hypothetical protein